MCRNLKQNANTLTYSHVNSVTPTRGRTLTQTKVTVQRPNHTGAPQWGAQTDTVTDNHRYLTTKKKKRPLPDKLCSLSSTIPGFPCFPSHLTSTQIGIDELLHTNLRRNYWKCRRRPFSRWGFQKPECERKTYRGQFIPLSDVRPMRGNKTADGRECESGWDAEFVASVPPEPILVSVIKKCLRLCSWWVLLCCDWLVSWEIDGYDGYC